MSLFSAQQKGSDEPYVTAEKPSQPAITTTVEQVPEENEKTAETAFEGEVTEAKTKGEASKKEVSLVKETVIEECTEFTEESITEIEDDKTFQWKKQKQIRMLSMLKP